ncbi:MAG: hypothetical protein RXQ22_09275 [Sulfolobus sp.]
MAITGTAAWVILRNMLAGGGNITLFLVLVVIIIINVSYILGTKLTTATWVNAILIASPFYFTTSLTTQVLRSTQTSTTPPVHFLIKGLQKGSQG